MRQSRLKCLMNVDNYFEISFYKVNCTLNFIVVLNKLWQNADVSSKNKLFYEVALITHSDSQSKITLE